MTESLELAAKSRTVIGKASRRLSREGLLPAVLYGVGHESQAISIDRHRFEQMSRHGGLTSSLIQLSVDEDKPVNVIVKSIQQDPVKGTIVHADLWAVNMTQKITTVVPVHFIGDAVGVKSGGVMMHNVQQVHVESLPTALPDHLEADVSELEVGDSLHVSDLKAPDGVTVLDSGDEILCSVVTPRVLEVSEEVVEEEAVPEVGEAAEE